MLCDDMVVSVRNLTKTYRLFGHPSDRIKQFFSFGLKPYHQQFTALHDISFDIRRGETIGIIGPNGSGKSTLLQMICGILKPTAGTVCVRGRVSALLELGAGFNPEFTGRENVYFQGALMGLSEAQVDERFDAIAAFADIGRFIDIPVRTYSSGMYVRLAFSAIIHTDSDILVVDEALAVGDESFQRKCFARLEEILSERRVVLFFVSHNIRQVERVCSRAFLLENGRIRLAGPAAEVCNAYHNAILRDTQAQLEASCQYQCTASGELDLLNISMSPLTGSAQSEEFVMHAPARISIRFRCHTYLRALEVIAGFHTADSVYVASSSSAARGKARDFEPGEHSIECHVPDMMLAPGIYHIRIAFLDRYRRSIWDGHRLHTFRVVPDPQTNFMRMPQLSLVDIPFNWSFEDPENAQCTHDYDEVTHAPRSRPTENRLYNDG